MRAGGVLNGMKAAYEFEDKSVVFIEQHLDHELVAGRSDRWWNIHSAKGGGTSAGTPMAMIDAGREIQTGDMDFTDVYGRMIDESLARPALVDVKAWWQKAGENSARVQIDIKNLTEATIDPWESPVYIVLLFYDDRTDVALEGTVRGGQSIFPEDIIEPGETLSMDVEVPELGRVNWDDPSTKLVAMVEHEVGGAWDVMNAAVGTQGERVIDPGTTSQPPVVDVTSPAEGSAYILGDTVTFQAEASDPDGTVAEVAWYVGISRVAVTTAAPWRFEWEAVGTGMKSVMAQAKDDTGQRTRSEPVDIRVRLVAPPTPTPRAADPGPWDPITWIFMPIARFDW